MSVEAENPLPGAVAALYARMRAVGLNDAFRSFSPGASAAGVSNQFPNPTSQSGANMDSHKQFFVRALTWVHVLLQHGEPGVFSASRWISERYAYAYARLAEIAIFARMAIETIDLFSKMGIVNDLRERRRALQANDRQALIERLLVHAPSTSIASGPADAYARIGAMSDKQIDSAVERANINLGAVAAALCHLVFHAPNEPLPTRYALLAATFNAENYAADPASPIPLLVLYTELFLSRAHITNVFYEGTIFNWGSLSASPSGGPPDKVQPMDLSTLLQRIAEAFETSLWARPEMIIELLRGVNGVVALMAADGRAPQAARAEPTTSTSKRPAPAAGADASDDGGVGGALLGIIAGALEMTDDDDAMRSEQLARAHPIDFMRLLAALVYMRAPDMDSPRGRAAAAVLALLQGDEEPVRGPLDFDKAEARLVRLLPKLRDAINRLRGDPDDTNLDVLRIAQTLYTIDHKLHAYPVVPPAIYDAVYGAAYVLVKNSRGAAAALAHNLVVQSLERALALLEALHNAGVIQDATLDAANADTAAVRELVAAAERVHLLAVETGEVDAPELGALRRRLEERVTELRRERDGDSEAARSARQRAAARETGVLGALATIHS